MPGFFQGQKGHTRDCNSPPENHCSKDADGNPQNFYMGMEEVSGKFNCVENCPAGSVVNTMSRRCDCPQYSEEKWVDLGSGKKKRFCECPAHSAWDSAANKCSCTAPKVLTDKGCQIDHSE